MSLQSRPNNITATNIQVQLDESHKQSQLLLQQSPDNDSQCSTVKVGTKQYHVCNNYAKLQSDFFNHLVANSNKSTPTVEWSAQCKVRKNALSKRDEVEVSDQVANNIYLIYTYNRSDYAKLSVQDMICLLDYVLNNEDPTQKRDTLPEENLLLFCLQCIVVRDTETLNLLLILIGTFRSFFLRMTTAQHLLNLLLNGFRTVCHNKDQWWDLMLLVDYYFFSAAPTGDKGNEQSHPEALLSQEDIVALMHEQNKQEWRGQIMHVVSTTLANHYGSSDVVSVRAFLDVLFLQAGDKPRMKQLFIDWMTRMDNRIKQAIRNMIVCVIAKTFSFAVVKLDQFAPVDDESGLRDGQVTTSIDSDTYSCTRTESGWKIVYQNEKGMQFIQEDDQFQFAQTTEWSTMALMGMQSVKSDAHTQQRLLIKAIDVDAIRVRCLIGEPADYARILSWFLTLPMSQLLSKDDIVQLPFTHSDLIELFERVTRSSVLSTTEEKVDLFSGWSDQE